MDKLKRYITMFGIWAAVWIFAFGPDVLEAARKKKGPPVIDAGVSWWAVVYSVVALLGICVVAFKDPKRTHLD